MNAIGTWFYRLFLANPQAVRIVQGGSRRFPHQLFRASYLGTLVVIVLFALLASGGTGTLSLNELAKSGSQVFRAIAYGQVVLVCLLAPLFMASALGSEQQGETYDILLTTPLSNLQIVYGSLMGRLFFIVALLASGLPLFSVLLLFGGVPIASVFKAFLVAVCTATFVGSVAVTISVFRAGGRRAVFAFVVTIAAYLVGAWALDVALLRRLVPVPGTSTFLTPLHPLLVLETLVGTANYRPPTPPELAGLPGWYQAYLGRPLAVFAWWTLGGSAAMLLGSAAVLRRMSQGDWKPVLLLKRLTGGGLRERTGRTVSNQPIAWREAHARGRTLPAILGKTLYLGATTLVAAGLLSAYHFDRLPQVPGRQGTLDPAEVFRTGLLVLLMLQVAVLTLVALYTASGSVSKEREDGTLDLILTTPVTPRLYVQGKLKGLIRFLAVFIAAPLVTLTLVTAYTLIAQALDWPTATYTVLLQAGTTESPLLFPEAPLIAALMIVPFAAACAAGGMLRSLKSKTVLSAAGFSVGIAGLLIVVAGFVGFYCVQSVWFIGPIFNALSPATNLLMIVDPWDTLIDFRQSPASGRLYIAFGAALSAAIYTGAVWTCINMMLSGFDQSVRQLSGTK